MSNDVAQNQEVDWSRETTDLMTNSNFTDTPEITREILTSDAVQQKDMYQETINRVIETLGFAIGNAKKKLDKSFEEKPMPEVGGFTEEGLEQEVEKFVSPTTTDKQTEEALTDAEDTDTASSAIDAATDAVEVQQRTDIPEGGLGSPIREPDFSPIDEAIKYNDEFNKKLVDDLRVLEGLGGDTLTDIPTYSYGITEEKADEYNLEPSQFETMEDFAIAFSDKYVKEKKAANREVFSAVDEKHHIALMSYLWNTGVFGPRQKEALEENDMEEFISEMRDAIHIQGNSSSGLSMRRAKEANMIGENLDDWTPIHKVVVSGTRASPTFEWQTESGEIVETYTSDRSLHSGNIPNKPNQTDTLDEEIIL